MKNPEKPFPQIHHPSIARRQSLKKAVQKVRSRPLGRWSITEKRFRLPFGMSNQAMKLLLARYILFLATLDIGCLFFSGTTVAQSNTSITKGPFPPAEQAPSHQGNHVWPNPSHYVRQMKANDTPEQQAEGKAVDDLSGVLATAEKTIPPTSSSTIVPEGPKGHRLIVFITGPITSELRHRIPPTIDGYPVVIHEKKHPAPPLNEMR